MNDLTIMPLKTTASSLEVVDKIKSSERPGRVVTGKAFSSDRAFVHLELDGDHRLVLSATTVVTLL